MATQQPTQWELGVSYILHLWPALTAAVESQWGGPDSADKRAWLCGAIADMFTNAPPAQTALDGSIISGGEPDEADVEETLLQVMQDEFEVAVDDDSSLQVAKDIVALRQRYLQGDMSAVETLRTKFENRSRSGASAARSIRVIEKEGDETDDDYDDEGSGMEDDEDEDEEMSGIAETPERREQEKPRPVIDDDGFELVQKRRK